MAGSRVLGRERCAIEWWTGDSRLARLNYAMHSIDDLRDAVKGWLHSRRWMTGKQNWETVRGLLGKAILDWVRLRFPAGVSVLVARDSGRKAWLGRVSEGWEARLGYGELLG